VCKAAGFPLVAILISPGPTFLSTRTAATRDESSGGLFTIRAPMRLASAPSISSSPAGLQAWRCHHSHGGSPCDAFDRGLHTGWADVAREHTAPGPALTMPTVTMLATSVRRTVMLPWRSRTGDAATTTAPNRLRPMPTPTQRRSPGNVVSATLCR